MPGKKTPLYDRHVALGGRMVDFGGWALPVQYASGILKEHEQVRARCGLFDVSHMGEIWVRGPEACAWLHSALTNDIQSLVPGQVRYSPMCASDGGTVDDVLVYCFSKELYLMVVNAANDDKDYAHLSALRSNGVTLEHVSHKMGQLALQGPMAAEILARYTDVPLSEMGYYSFLPETKVAGIPVLLSRTGYTGEDGFELYAAWEETGALWNALLEDPSVQPIGLGA
ncbi:MAG TPA: glycine cleavage system aminomethyltransferase GcvT, partial [Clostridia bacterium]|nr:glycine cleavage system aminomethyltransferase GcvT [Clostridia bacterium]